ncbi:MAG: tetratricopeptide repeat protein [Bryobacteraceae bacterium]|nr:tetratricopeptide repeat protein [Bryobacteraceae bacterium]
MYALLLTVWLAQAHPLDEAYAELRAHHYDAAIALFHKGLAGNPDAVAPRKDLAYTLLKVGDPDSAREQFGLALQHAPQDHHLALEYAFLCFEAKERRLARLIFDRVRREGDPASRATAQTAFTNIDGELAAGLARWLAAAQASPGKFSIHQEIAHLAEERDSLDLAAEHYALAWKLRPDMREFLLDLGRVHTLAKRPEPAFAALLAASHATEPRIAERARGLLGGRYPYVYEFGAALALDPENVSLRRELGFLLLAMRQPAEAEAVFTQVLARAKDDWPSLAQLGMLRLKRARNEEESAAAKELLTRVLAGSPDLELKAKVNEAMGSARQLNRFAADQSYAKGFLHDALRLYRLAQEREPDDATLQLRLGWTLNMLKQDAEAITWFDRARHAADPKIAAEAERAYRNLRPQFAPVRLSVWSLPMYSTRWRAGFSYGQLKSEFRVGHWAARPYLSLRFVGDTGTLLRQAAVVNGALSERAVIPAVGLSGRLGPVTLWGEAGLTVPFTRGPHRADYRGGASFGKAWGHPLPGKGWFATTNDDAVFVSRFDRDTIVYSLNRLGYSWGRVQAGWNSNFTFDLRRFWWGNFVETGPGVKLQVAPRLALSADALRGRHLVLTGIPVRPTYYDLRVSLWYAATY